MARRLVKGLTGLLLLRQFVHLLAYLRERRAGRKATKVASAVLPNPAEQAQLRKRLLVSLVIGVLIELALILGQSYQLPILIATEDAAMDFVMRQFRNVARDEHTAFFLLETDQATFELWEEPFYFHRDRVQEMIEFASGFSEQAEVLEAVPRPELIVVDIDLSKRGLEDGSRELENYLRAYSEAPNPPLILARTLRVTPAGESDDALPRERPSFLDKVVADSDNVFWASPHYQLDQDYRIRRWLLWQKTRRGEKESVLPSVQLLAMTLLSEGDSGSPAQRHDSLVSQLKEAACDTPGQDDAVLEFVRGGRQQQIPLCDSLTSQRLIYTMPYETRAGERRPKVRGGAPVLERTPAIQLAAQDRARLAGTVTVIGGTYRETRDWYATPMGEMPGAMVVINAIHSLGAHGPLSPPHWTIKILIVVLLVLTMSVLFARLSSFLAYLATSAAVLALLLPVSFLMFRSGVWVDFALPLLAVQIHEFAAEFESIDFKSKKPTDATLEEHADDPEVASGDGPEPTNDEPEAV
jgi:hypothetical protein